MADVRALLRQQRAARRIEHPHAAYSDAGKLLCTVCREQIKTESLWDGHIRSAGHRQRLQALQAKPTNGSTGSKRKLDEDEEMEDDTPEDEGARTKRSKPDMITTTTTDGKDSPRTPGSGGKPHTPPLTRRQSGTPVLGVEMQIPSRPATPVALRETGGGSFTGSFNGSFTGSTTGSASGGGGGGGGGSQGAVSAATTPKTAPVGRSPLIPQEQPSSLPSSAGAVSSVAGFATADTPEQPKPTAETQRDGVKEAAVVVDDDVWAAFEADLVHGTTTIEKPTTTINPPLFTGDVVISAPAMTAAEMAAKSEEEERQRKRTLVDMEIEDEREDAVRARETEFEEMEELEARVRKLREKREQLLRIQRQQSNPDLASTAAAAADQQPKLPPPRKEVAAAAASSSGKENTAAAAAAAANDEEEDEDEEDEDEEDAWVGFRFRAQVH